MTSMTLPCKPTVLFRCITFSLVIFSLTSRASADSTSGIKFFESKIRPVLVEHCYGCHSETSGKSRGGLKVDSYESMIAGGDTGPAIVPRSLQNSLLYESILYGEDSYQMPPKGKLSAQTIDDFRRWILMGAPDPRTTKIGPDVSTKIDVEQGRSFWAYQPLVPPTLPQVQHDGWANTDIDRFVSAKRREHNLHPVPDASPNALIRRLYFVLTGLPPSPDDVERFRQQIENASPDSRQQVIGTIVDELLDSARFGEHWGRHWMDVARYAESTGGDQNNLFPHAWRYRDYVIDAFNDDKPFDQFIREQIAGDLLPIANDREWADNVIATGFLAIGTKLVGEEDQQTFFADLVDEQIDTTTRAFLATTVACARCHDHKFDPIPQEDYYALAGIFRSTETHYGLLKAQARQATTLLDLTGMGPPPGTEDLSDAQLAQLIQQRDDAAKAVTDAMTKIRSGENVFRGTLRRLRSQRDETEAAFQAYGSGGQPRVFAMGTQDRDFPLPTRLLVRGEVDKPAQQIPRGVLQVLAPPGKHRLSARTKGSGRLELANWITWDKNPLTARVIANRVWHWMFGRGIVRTVDDFGNSGDRPSHPELLDHLAIQFVDHGWSVKELIRQIAMSRTWQLSSNFDESSFTIDPDNQFLWRMNTRRIEAESIRDAMLLASESLDLQRPVGTYLREVGEGQVGQNVFEPIIREIESNVRSVYLPRVRSVLPEMLEVFDAPDASLVTGARETTSSPIQSLFLLNNKFVQRQATELARRINGLTADQQIHSAYAILFARDCTAAELELGRAFLSDSTQHASMTRLQAYCQALFCTTEFQTID